MFQSITANLMVENVKDSMAYYQSVLGFSEAASVPGDGEVLNFAILVKDNLSLMLQEKNNLIGEYPSLKTDKIKPCITLYIVVDNFEEAYAAIKEKTELIQELHKTFYGSREFALSDPDGYVITIAENNN